MEQQIAGSFIRVAFAYFLVMLLVRLIGRKVISQMTFFDYVVGITYGSVTANLALGPNAGVASAVTVLVGLALMIILTEFVRIKSFKWRKLINSEPVTVVANGKIVKENMDKTRFSINDLMMLLREKNIFNVADVEFALMESDGKISVLPKSQKQPLTPSDLNISTTYKGLTKDLIIDGCIMEDNLQDINLDQHWLKDRLLSYGIKEPEDVFYAGLDTSGNLYVSVKRENIEKPGKYGIE